MVGATVLFLPYPSASGTWGSVVKLAAIAEEIRARGHRVVFHAGPPTDGLLSRRGFEVIRSPVAAVPGTPATPRAPGTPGVPGTPGAPGAINSFYDVCAALGFADLALWRSVLEAEAEAVRRVGPDVLVSHMRLSAPITAARFALPLASCASWCTDPRGQSRGDDPLDSMARTLSDPVDLCVESVVELVSWHANVQLATSYPIFEPELVDAPRTVYTGYLQDPAAVYAWSRPIPARLVLGYASTAPWCTDRVVGAMADAAARADAVLWCVTRAGGPAGRISEHAELFSYLPFERLLAHAGAVVFHGGQGTALGCLRYGVPSLSVPGQHYERRYNCERLAALGAGVHGGLTDLRGSRLHTILSDLLDGPGTVPGGPWLEQGRTGAATAADAVLALVPERRRPPTYGDTVAHVSTRL